MEIELRGEAGTAGQLFKSCVDLFWLLIQRINPIENIEQEQNSALRDELGRLYFWGEGFHPENGTLDEILRLSASLRDQTISLLMDVGSTLCSRKTGLFRIIVSDGVDSKLDAQRQDLLFLIERLEMGANEIEEFDTDSNISGDTDVEFSLASVLEDLQFYIGCLAKLTLSLEHPAPDPLEAETEPVPAVTFNVARPAEIWCRKIRDKFPDIEIRLAERLGEANWYRFERINRMGGASDRKLLEEAEESENEESGMPASQARSVISTITKSSFPYKSVLDASSSGKRSAATADPPLPTLSVHRFKPTDILGSDQIKRTPLVLNVEDFATLHVLKVPPEALDKTFFYCPICKNELYNVKDEFSWRKHVFADLQPYVCTVSDCERSLAPFKTRKAWAQHEFNSHRLERTWKCGDCWEDFVDQKDFRNHISSYPHSYTDLEKDLMIHKAETEKAQSRKELACPFCNVAPGSTIYGFASHVGSHLEDIALGLLPDPDGASENDSGTPSDREGNDLFKTQSSGVAIPSGMERGENKPPKPETYICPEPGCNKSFERLFSLISHRENVHRISLRIECPEVSCQRTGLPAGRDKVVFSRMDHFYEHVKKVHHKEVVQDSTGSIWVKASDGQMWLVRWTDTFIKECHILIQNPKTTFKNYGWRQAQRPLWYVDRSEKQTQLDWWNAYLENVQGSQSLPTYGVLVC